MEYSVYFAGPELPTRAAWEAKLSASGFPVALEEDFSYEPEDQYARARYGDAWFEYGFFIADADATMPAEAIGARSVAVFQPIAEVGDADEIAYTAMLASTFAELANGLMRNDATGELFRGAEAVEYARWLLTVPESES